MKSPWFPAAGRNSRARARLFCFPHAGGGASLFGTWPPYFPDRLEVVSGHLPGHEERYREPAFVRMEPLLDALEHAIMPFLDLPFSLFGHSLGAWVAFYLARRLRQSSLRLPARLLVSGCRAPHLPSRHERIHDLPQAQLLSEMQRRYAPIPAAILDDREMLALVVDALRADFALLETTSFRAEEPLPCPISSFRGDKDSMVDASESRDWARHTRAGFHEFAVRGNHFYLRPPGAEVLALFRAQLEPLAMGAPCP